MEFTSITVYLGVNYLTSFGENLCVVGNIPELGDWDVTKGFKLNYHEVSITKKILV